MSTSDEYGAPYDIDEAVYGLPEYGYVEGGLGYTARIKDCDAPAAA